MEIKKISTEQFAGINDVEYDFEKGLNLIVGDNESGKSTIVDLMYHLFFQEAKLDNRSKDSKDFTSKYTPKKNGLSTNYMQGSIVFDGKDGSYKLEKEWSKKGSAKLVLPNKARVTDSKGINDELSKVLEYKQGVYDEVVFASQKRDMRVLNYLLPNDLKKDSVSSDFTATLRRAVVEMGGISIDKLETKLVDTLKSYESHWDFTLDQPKDNRGITNKWEKQVGAILKAYYEYKEIEAKRDNLIGIEDSIDSKNQELTSLQKEHKNLTDKKEDFQKFAALIKSRNAQQTVLDNTKTSLGSQKDTYKAWPIAIQNLEKAQLLKSQKEMVEVKENYLDAKEKYDRVTSLEEQIKTLVKVEDEDFKNAKTYDTQISKAKNKLAGLDLVANIKKLGSNSIQVTSISTGESIDIENGSIEIKEAIRIYIPGVLDLKLCPNGVDVEEIQKIIHESTESFNIILGKYKVSSFDELENQKNNYVKLENDYRNAKSDLAIALRGNNYDELEAKYKDIPEDLPSKKSIESAITSLIGRTNMDQYIGKKSNEIDGYTRDYVSLEKLVQLIDKSEKEIQRLTEELSKLEEIPEEYKNKDVDTYNNQLTQSIDRINKEIQDLTRVVGSLIGSLNGDSSEEYNSLVEDAKEAFVATKKQYQHYVNIYKAFVDEKNQMEGNPIEDIENSFRKYLSIISNGQISLENMEEKFIAKINSGDNELSLDTLSDGTKDTISLAFRLAMLEHIFPEGNGLAVFDDPFTDMDENRTVQACALIQEFAKNNQVIFTTCDHKYESLLTGNVIQINK